MDSKHGRALLGALLFLVAIPALASADKVAEIRDKNRAAMSDFDINEFENAKKGLNEALDIAKKAKLDHHPIAAETHMYLAIVQIAGMGDELEGIVEFVKALEINPTAQVPVDYRTPEVTKVFDKAKARAGKDGGGTPPAGGGDGNTGGGGDEPPPVKPKKPKDSPPLVLDCSSPSEGITHTPVDKATAGKDVKVDLCLGAEIQAAKVLVFYRPQGVEEFTMLVAKQDDKGVWRAVIKGGAVGGEYLHYYIEARNNKDVALVRSGAKDSPHIVEVGHPEEGGGGGGGSKPGKGGDDENPLAGGAGAGGSGGDDDNPGDSADLNGGVKKPGKGSGIYIGLAAGSGAGLLTGGNLEVAKDGNKSVQVNSGVAIAAFHLHLDLGYLLNPRTMIGVWGRFQLVTLADINKHAVGAVSAGITVRHNLAPQKKSHLFVQGEAGFGDIRHAVTLEKPPSNDMKATKDTARQGRIQIGGGAGYSIAMSSAMSFDIQTDVLAGIPAGGAAEAFAINADLNVGIGLAF